MQSNSNKVHRAVASHFFNSINNPNANPASRSQVKANEQAQEVEEVFEG